MTYFTVAEPWPLVQCEPALVPMVDPEGFSKEAHRIAPIRTERAEVGVAQTQEERVEVGPGLIRIGGSTNGKFTDVVVTVGELEQERLKPGTWPSRRLTQYERASRGPKTMGAKWRETVSVAGTDIRFDKVVFAASGWARSGST